MKKFTLPKLKATMAFSLMLLGSILMSGYEASSVTTLQDGGCMDDNRYWDDDRCPAAKDHCCGK
ncbi:MAG: hypothetical protein ACK5BJ_15110 [Bacteroidota bacterium]|jgi:hypothetical protein